MEAAGTTYRPPPLRLCPMACWCGAHLWNLPSLYRNGSIAPARDSVSLARPRPIRTPRSHRTRRDWPSASAIRRLRRATSGSLTCLRGTKTRLTFDPADDLDSDLVAGRNTDCFQLQPCGTRDLSPRHLSEAGGWFGLGGVVAGRKGRTEDAEDWSRDGKYLMYIYQASPQGSESISMCCLSPATGSPSVPEYGIPHPQGQFSPNGRWVAYRSMESGRMEVYVQGFTLDSSQPRGKWQVSVSRRGTAQMAPRRQRVVLSLRRHLLCRGREDRRRVLRGGIPSPCSTAPAISSSTSRRQPIRVTKDGQRFLVLCGG